MSNGVVHGELTLFDCPRIRKSEYWQFIKLVAPHAHPPEGQTQWLSQDANDAYCLKCSKTFRFTKGSSNSVRRHMERYHRKELLKRQAQLAQDAKKMTLGSAKVTVAATGAVGRRAKRTSSAQDAELLADEPLAATGASSTVVITQPGVKRYRMDGSGSSRYGVESLIKWLALSLRPLSIVDDPGFSCFAAAISGEQPFVVPTREALRHRLELMSENARFEVKQKLKKDVGQFALSAEIWRARVADLDASATVDSHVAIKCWYLSEEFVVQSLVLDVVPIERLTSSEKLTQLLDDFGLSKTLLSLLVLPQGSTLEHDAMTAANPPLRCIVDVAETLNTLVRCSLKRADSNGARASDHLELHVAAQLDELTSKQAAALQAVHAALTDMMRFVTWVRTDAVAHARLADLFPSAPLELTRFPALTFSDWSLATAHDAISRAVLLRAVLDGLVDRWTQPSGDSVAGLTTSAPEKIQPASWMTLEGLVVLWRPLHEVVQVTTNEKVCSLPFVLPILAMAMQLFARGNLFDDLKQRYDATVAAAATTTTTTTPVCGSADAELFPDRVISALSTLQEELLRGINSHYGDLCSSLAWISALDPRYARLRHMSDEERELCKEQLLEHAAELFRNQLPPLPSQPPGAEMIGGLAPPDFESEIIYSDVRVPGATAAPTIGSGMMPGLMHRLLYDEEEDVATADVTMNRETEIAQARLYIANELAVYFNEHQARKTRIACPLQWWSANRERLPFLAPLARVWLSTRASLAVSSDRVLSSELCESLGSKEPKDQWAKLAGDLIVLQAHFKSTPTGSVSL